MQQQQPRPQGDTTTDPALHPHSEVHVVPPTWQPLILAIGITLVLAGIAVTPIMWIVGAVICIIAIVNWLGELRRDYQAPSADHL